MSKDRTRYTEVHAGLWDNRKFKRLVRILGVEETTLVGILVSFWHSTQHQADVDTGRLQKWDHIDIAEAARWSGDSQKFVDALLSEKWIHRDIDGTYRMHEWEYYGGSGWTKKKDAAERTAASRMGISVAQYREYKKRQAESEPEQLVLESRDKAPFSRDVTVTPPTCNSDIDQKQRDVTQDPIRSDPNGSEPNREDDRGAQSGSGEPPNTHTPKNIRTGPALSGFSQRTPRHLTTTGIIEAQHAPKTPSEWISATQSLSKTHPCLSASPDVLLRAVTSRWHSYLNKLANSGRDSADAGLLEWLEDAEVKQARKLRVNGQQPPQPAQPSFRPRDLYDACIQVAEKRPPNLMRIYGGSIPIPPDPSRDLNGWFSWEKTDVHTPLIREAKKRLGVTA